MLRWENQVGDPGGGRVRDFQGEVDMVVEAKVDLVDDLQVVMGAPVVTHQEAMEVQGGILLEDTEVLVVARLEVMEVPVATHLVGIV